MPTIQQIEQAMIAAHRAGDTESARVLAGEINRLMTEAAAPPPKRGIGAAFERGLESQLSAGRTGLGVYTGSPEEAARAGLARQKEIGRKYEDQIGLDLLKKAYEEKGLLAAGKEVVRQVPLALAGEANSRSPSVEPPPPPAAEGRAKLLRLAQSSSSSSSSSSPSSSNSVAR